MELKIKRNEKGFSVFALLVALSLLGLIGYVLSSLMFSQQEATPRFLNSNWALYTAQAGLEWGQEYIKSNCKTFTTNPSSLFPQTQSLSTSAGTFSFTVSYSSGTLTSTSTVNNSRRSVALSTSTINCDISVDPAHPPYSSTQYVYFPLLNNSGSTLYPYQIDLAKSSSAALNQIDMQYFSAPNLYWSGSQVAISTTCTPTTFRFNSVPNYNTMSTGSNTNNYLKLQATSQTSGTWYMTIHYSTSFLLTNPKTVTLIFVI